MSLSEKELLAQTNLRWDSSATEKENNPAIES